jgi:hypothetical protein
LVFEALHHNVSIFFKSSSNQGLGKEK